MRLGMQMMFRGAVLARCWKARRTLFALSFLGTSPAGRSSSNQGHLPISPTNFVKYRLPESQV